MKRIHQAGWETTQGLNLRFPVAKQVWAHFHLILQPIYTAQMRSRRRLLLIKSSALKKHLRPPFAGRGGRKIPV